jgi:hypothetical protein
VQDIFSSKSLKNMQESWEGMDRKQDLEVHQWSMRERKQIEWLTLPPQGGRRDIYSPRGKTSHLRSFCPRPVKSAKPDHEPDGPAHGLVDRSTHRPIGAQPKELVHYTVDWVRQ